MTHNKAILLLGSDLGDKKDNLAKAKSFISKEIGEVMQESEILETQPVEFTSDTTFLNQIVVVDTKLSPFKLLEGIKQIEKNMGRVYTTPKAGEKYTSRIIDIDILYFNRLKVQSSVLNIPHYQIKTRKFVSRLLNNDIFTANNRKSLLITL